MLALLRVVARRAGHAEWGPGLVLVCLASPLLFYAHNTFGEMAAASLTVLFVAALVTRRSWPLVAGAAFLAGITKETAAPFLLALAVIVALGLRAQGTSIGRGRIVGVVVGLGSAVVANAAFNVFRYGGVANLDYTRGRFGQPRPPIDERLELFGGLFFAPNAGIVAFWPIAAMLLVAVAIFALPGARSRPAASRWPAVALVGVFLALQAGLASWQSPFGWFAWGPRLTLPWIPAFLAVAVVLHGKELESAVRWLTRTGPRLLAAALAVTLVAAPHIGVLRATSASVELFQPSTDPQCLRDDTAERYYACMQHRAWGRSPVLVSALRGVRTAGGMVTAASFLLASLALLVLMRERLAPAHPAGRR